MDSRIDPRFLSHDKRLSPDERQVRAVAHEFESVMIGQMLKTMRSTTDPGMLEGGSAMRTYREMLDDEMAKEMAKGRGLGLSDALTHELMRANRPPTSPSTKGPRSDR